MKVLIVIADADEFNPFSKNLEELVSGIYPFYNLSALKFNHAGIDATVICTGMGKVNAATGTALALAEGSYDAVINTGWSGAVTGLLKGDIVAGTSCVECDFDLTPIGYAPGQKSKTVEYIYETDKALLEKVGKIPGFKCAKLGTGDFFLTDKEKSDYYKKLFSISAFDMESGAIASVCHLLNIPFISVRKISDNADDTAGDIYRESLVSDDTAFTEIVYKVMEALA